MDALDTALMIAFGKAQQRVVGDASGAAAAELARRASSRVVSANLRSRALVLRACDSRIPDDNAQGAVRVDAARVKAWCGPVAIAWPGVSLDEAAKLFGVNRTTVSRWADPRNSAPAPEVPLKFSEPAGNSTGRMPVPLKIKRVTWNQAVSGQIAAAEELHAGDRFGAPASYRVLGRRLNLEYTLNRANRKRDVVRVWTPRVCGLDPGGEVWAGPWGEGAAARASGVPEAFSQVLTRVDRRLGGKSRVWQWVCPADRGGCGRLVYKVYLPLPVWTVGAALGPSQAGFEALRGMAWDRGFLCRRCADLVYESAERGSSPGVGADGGRRRVDVMDRFAKRISGGAVTGRALREAGASAGKCDN